MNLNWIAVVLSVIAVGIGGYLFFNPVHVSIPAGATGSPDHYNFEQFFAGMSTGQGAVASSTSASVTMSGSEFLNVDTLNYTPNVLSLTLTLPASTTPMCASLPINQRRSVFIRNASTTAADALTIAGGTGTLLRVASSSAIIAGTTNGTGIAELKILRLASSDCLVMMTSFK